MLIHLTARTAFGTKPFVDAREAWWLWRRLRLHFPHALTACLMPDHVHLALDAEPLAATERLARLLAAARRHRPPQAWGRVRDATPIADARHLQRQIRYVHLNPCRAGLVRDPLAWPWSTHRGVIGAEARPWVSAATLAARFRRDEQGFARWFHAYVSGDTSAAVTGTAFPTLVPPAKHPSFSLTSIRAALDSAALWCNVVTRRRALVQLARQQGWRNGSGLPELCATSPRTVRRHTACRLETVLLEAARLCLGDTRLVLAPEVLSAIGERSRARVLRRAA